MPATPPISSLLIKPAGPDCNLACAYCFYRPAGDLYPDQPVHRMSLTVLREVVAQYMAMSETPAFCWQGGEPTLMGVDFFRTVIALQKKYGHTGQVVANSLQTNGILVNDEWARLMARYRFLVGVSLDGPPEIHDRYRLNQGGQPTLKAVLRGLKAMQHNQVECNALCMVTPLSVGHARDIFEFLRAQGLEYLQFIPCVEKDPQSGELAEFGIPSEAYGEFLCDIFDLWLPEREAVHVRLIEDTIAALLGAEEARSCVFRDRCGDYVVVEHNGDVYACDFFVDPPHYYGNLTETPLEELLKLPALEEFAQRKSDLHPRCQACEWLGFCRGGCQKHRVFRGGTVDSRDYLCEGHRIFFEHAAPRLREIVEEEEGEDGRTENRTTGDG